MDPMDQRREAIVELTNKEGNLSFAQLKEHFPQVSDMTLRTDLRALDEQKRVIRVHGGVRSVQVVIGTDDLFGRRAARNTAQKQAIAEKAVKLLEPHTTIFLDSGSTCTMLAKIVPDMPCIIFTSGLSCAIELAKLDKPQVRVPGGELNHYSLSVCGLSAIAELERVNFDIAIIGVTCYSKATGFTCGVAEEAELKRKVMQRAQKKVLLMDSSKVDRRSTYTFCGLDDIDALISDGGLPEDMKTRCKDAGIRVL